MKFVSEKLFDVIIPGNPTGVSVLPGQLSRALSEFKKRVKKGGKLEILFDGKDGYKNPSYIKNKKRNQKKKNE